MSARCLRSNNPSRNGEESTECMVNLSVQQFKPGDIVWNRIDGGSWWPMQVVDEKCVAYKPKKRKNDQILVRLYGTFEHMYVEPVNCVSKIEKIFGQENSSNREVFQKTLEEDLAHMISVGHSDARVSESKENDREKDEAPRGKGQRKGKLKRTTISDNSPLVGSSDNPKAAKQVKVVMGEGMDNVKASGDGIVKRRTRSETFKARNEGKSEIELSNETQNVKSGASTISSLDKKDLRSSRRKDAKDKLTSNALDKAFEPKCVKQDCGWNPDLKKNAQIEFSNVKDIKKLVAKIVKEVAAEKARNESLKGKAVESCPANTEHIENSWKESSEIKNMKRHSPRRVKNKDIEDTQDKTDGPGDVGKPNGADKVSNGVYLVKIRSDCSPSKGDFDSDNSERTKDAGMEIPKAAEQAINVTHGINGVQHRYQLTRSKGCLKETDGDEKSQAKFAKQGETMKSSETEKAINGHHRGKVVKQDVLREQMDSPGTTKCFLSPRCTRVMQSLGLIAPLGSPFCRNGLI